MFAAQPVLVHEIECSVATAHTSPPFGACTVTEGLPGGKIVKSEELDAESAPAGLERITRTRAWLVGVSGTIHGWDPLPGPEPAAISDQLPPASVE